MFRRLSTRKPSRCGSLGSLPEVEAKGPGNTFAIRRIGFRAMSDPAPLDLFRYPGHSGRSVGEQNLFLPHRHQVEQLVRLRVIVVALAMIVVGGIARDLQRWLLARSGGLSLSLP